MRVWLVLAVALGALALAPPGARAEVCKATFNGATYEYPCGSGDPKASAPDETPWYFSQGFQTGLGIVGLMGSAAAAGYTYYRVRDRRRSLADFLAAVERTYSEAKRAPEVGIPKLVDLRVEVRARHDHGRLEDTQFLELDKRIGDYIVRLRLFEIDRGFSALPAPFLAELRHLVSDGVVTVAEADLVEAHAFSHRIPEPQRSQLIRTVRGWAREDEGPLAVAVSAQSRPS